MTTDPQTLFPNANKENPAIVRAYEQVREANTALKNVLNKTTLREYAEAQPVFDQRPISDEQEKRVMAFEAIVFFIEDDNGDLVQIDWCERSVEGTYDVWAFGLGGKEVLIGGYDPDTVVFYE